MLSLRILYVFLTYFNLYEQNWEIAREKFCSVLQKKDGKKCLYLGNISQPIDYYVTFVDQDSSQPVQAFPVHSFKMEENKLN